MKANTVNEIERIQSNIGSNSSSYTVRKSAVARV